MEEYLLCDQTKNFEHVRTECQHAVNVVPGSRPSGPESLGLSSVSPLRLFLCGNSGEYYKYWEHQIGFICEKSFHPFATQMSNCLLRSKNFSALFQVVWCVTCVDSKSCFRLSHFCSKKFHHTWIFLPQDNSWCLCTSSPSCKVVSPQCVNSWSADSEIYTRERNETAAMTATPKRLSTSGILQGKGVWIEDTKQSFSFELRTWSVWCQSNFSTQKSVFSLIMWSVLRIVAEITTAIVTFPMELKSCLKNGLCVSTKDQKQEFLQVCRCYLLPDPFWPYRGVHRAPKIDGSLQIYVSTRAVAFQDKPCTNIVVPWIDLPHRSACTWEPSTSVKTILLKTPLLQLQVPHKVAKLKCILFFCSLVRCYQTYAYFCNFDVTKCTALFLQHKGLLKLISFSLRTESLRCHWGAVLQMWIWGFAV